MMLSQQDAACFYRLHPALLLYTNKKKGIISRIKTLPALMKLPMAKKYEIRQALWQDLSLIDKFVRENPQQLPDAELDIVRSWKRCLVGSFWLFRCLKKHAIFLVEGESPRAYGVCAITTPFAEMIPLPLPQMIETVLIPFKDKIIFDGFLQTYNVYFGPGIRRNRNEDYRLAKAHQGVITRL